MHGRELTLPFTALLGSPALGNKEPSRLVEAARLDAGATL